MHAFTPTGPFSMSEPRIRTRRLLLRQLKEEDVTQAYVDWLNDAEVNRYLEVRFSPQSWETVVSFVRRSLDPSSRTLHLGVFDQDGTRLVGTVTFHNMDERHLSASISFVIGHPDARGKGYGSEAVHAATYYIFTEKKYAKLWGGYYDGHRASEKVFLKNGFRIEGKLKGKLVDFRGERVDHVFMGLLAEEFRPYPEIFAATGKH